MARRGFLPDPTAFRNGDPADCRNGALNSLPEIQGRRIDAHIILGKSIKEIAEAEGVHEESIRQSIKRGLERMKKIF